MELLHYWNLIRKRIWLIIGLVCMAMVAASYYVLNQDPQYRTSTTLLINPATLDSTVSYQMSDGLVPLANTYMEFMQSRSFASAVAKELEAQALPVEPKEDEIIGAIVAQYVDDTQLFRIAATYRDPVVAKAMADTTAQMLIEGNEERIRAEQTALLNAQSDTRRVHEIDQLAEAINLLRTELIYYEDQIQALEHQITVLNSGPQSTESDTEILAARNQLLNYRSSRVDLLGSLADSQKALLAETERANSNVDTVVVVEKAWLPDEPLPRNLLQPLLAAIAAALTLGVALAVGLEYFDSSVKNPEELDFVYGMPTLGAIGIVDDIDPVRGKGSELIMLHKPRTAIAESIRVLRTAVRMASIGKPLHSLLITSARPGEGKTFTAANLAISIAQAGKRVILVDADLRRPEIHRAFGLRREPGFTNLVVEDEFTLAQALQPTRIPNLQVLVCGTPSPNPAELLSSEQASALIQALSEQADLVIYDSSPAVTVTDAILIAPQVDGVVQIVNSRGTRTDLVLRCKELLERSGARVIGPVLNRVAVTDLGYFINYYENDGYHLFRPETPVVGRGWRGFGPRKQKQGTAAKEL
ncbi:MAG: polysaccharide biosynthesis tyrosine autokinase [Caldilineaceae bacterium]|nr:polysaccharide biosynthesis tyrosine autokinase [Caldilineaceae bacterium]